MAKPRRRPVLKAAAVVIAILALFGGVRLAEAVLGQCQRL